MGFDFSLSWVEEDVLILWFACVFREMNMVADSCAGLAWWLMEDGGRVDVLGWINGTSMLVNDVSSTRAPEESKADDLQRRCRSRCRPCLAHVSPQLLT